MLSVDSSKLHYESLFVPHVVYFVFCLLSAYLSLINRIADLTVMFCVLINLALWAANNVMTKLG